MVIQKKVDTWKLKKWFSVYASKQFKDAMIGEMPANDEKSAMGRKIVVGLDALTHNPSHAYTNVVFRVTNVEGASAHTQLVSINLLYSYIRSLVRRYKSIASSVLPVSAKDGTQIVMKMLVITKQRTTQSRRVGLRKELNEFTTQYVKGVDLSELVTALIEGKFQAEMASKLKHITPISKVEIRAMEVKQ